MPSYTAGEEADRSNQTTLMEMTLYIYVNTPLESGCLARERCSWWSFHLCFSGAIFQQPCKNLHSCRPHDMFLKFSPFYECLELSAFPFRALLLSVATPPFDTDSPWQHQAWQILAEIVGELSGTNSLISLYPVISWLETWKGRKVRESGKMEQDLCPLLSTPARAPQPRLGLLSGKYVTPLTSFDSESPSGTKL